MRTLIRAVLVLALIAVVGFLFVGFWWGGTPWRDADIDRGAPGIGTSGDIDTDRARERAAELGEKAVAATERVTETLEEAGVTAKIKAKMALDDSLEARSIGVSTSGSTVTLTGRVPSEAARDRAVRLARETAGVTDVVDHLNVVAGS